MTRRLPVRPAPGPLEEYATRFDDLFGRARAQREGFRRYLEGLLLPAERNKTLTALANTEPVAGAQHIMLWRYWRGFTDRDPPEGLRALLERVFSGEGLYLYVH